MLQRSIGILIGLGLALALGDGGHKINVLDTSTAINREISSLLVWVIVFAALVFVVVTGAMAYVVIKFRRTGKEQGEPAQISHNDPLEIGWTVVPFVICLVIFGITAQSMLSGKSDINKPLNGALTIKVVGYQFWWDIEYPELGIRSGNDIVVPVGKPVHLQMTSNDVIHSFWVTSLVGKNDAIPGMVTNVYFTPEKEGSYYGQCAELCGPSHANMRFRINVVSQEVFDRFVQGAAAFAVQPAADPQVARGEELFNQQCMACHMVKGTIAQGRIGPDLTYFGNRATFGAGIWDNKPDSAQLVAWIRNSPGVKPGSKMPAFPGLTEDDAKAIAAYLHSLKVANVDLASLPKY